MEPQSLTSSSTPAQSPVEQKSPHSNKMFKIVLLVFLFLLLAAVITYAYQNYQPEQETQIVPPTETAVIPTPEEWKTYTNNEYGFEIKFPSNANALYSDDHFEDVYIQVEGSSITIDPKNKEKVTLPINEWLNKNGYEILLKKNIGGEEALMVAPEVSQEGGSNTSRNFKYYLSHNQQVFVIRTANVAFTDEIEQKFDQILSSFRFVEEADTSTWKTYISKNNIYQFKYPPSLKFSPSSSGLGLELYTNSPDELMGDIIPFNVLVYEEQMTRNTTLANWVQEKTIISMSDGTIKSSMKGTVIPYSKVSYEAVTFDTQVENELKHIYLKNQTNYVVSFSLSAGYDTGSSYKDSTEGQKTLDQILSTFKFLK